MARSKRSSTSSGSSRTGRTPCNTDAEELLTNAGYSVKRVVRVEPDALLYVDRFDRAWTAYIEAREKDGKHLCRVVMTVPGFPA